MEEKLLAEIKETLDGRPPTYEEIKGMKYANAVFSETLRLHPSVPKNIKEAIVDEVLPDGTKIPKGCMVIWSAYALGRRKDIWGPDAKVFNPDRWINPTRTMTAAEYPVFHAGPRICLGKSLAELEAVFVLVSLIGSYKISVNPDQKITYANSLTLPMKYGLKCKVARRN